MLLPRTSPPLETILHKTTLHPNMARLTNILSFDLLSFRGSATAAIPYGYPLDTLLYAQSSSYLVPFIDIFHYEYEVNEQARNPIYYRKFKSLKS